MDQDFVGFPFRRIISREMEKQDGNIPASALAPGISAILPPVFQPF